MPSDIDVDESQLHQFIQVLESFQANVADNMKIVMSAYQRCDETWKGASANQFKGQFEQTQLAVHKAIEVGDEALDWLRRFDAIVRDFERY